MSVEISYRGDVVPARHASNQTRPRAFDRIGQILKLADETVQRLVALCIDVRRVPSRTVVAEEGDRQSQVYLILEGWACRCRYVDDSRRQITSLLLPGDFSNPELDLDPKLGIDHTVCALTPLTYAVMETEDLGDLAAEVPELALALRLQRRREQSIQREWAVSLGRRSASERVAHLVCELQRRLGGGGSGGMTIEMPLLQSDIADAVGLTPIHVNRMLQQLRSQGLIQSSHNSLTISDLAKLQRHACFDETYLRLAGLG